MYAIYSTQVDDNGNECRPLLLGGLHSTLGEARNELNRLARRTQADENPLTEGWTEQFTIVELISVESRTVDFNSR